MTSDTNLDEEKQWLPLRPVPPYFPVPSRSINFPTAMDQIQSFINAFQYNFTSNPFVKPKKTGGSRHILEIYQLLVDLCLPIQCVEAVFIAAILSAPFREVCRIPISFESKCEGHIHKHIVLAAYCGGQWGAIGISRRDSLMNKPLQYSSLWLLIEEFERSYQSVGHSLTLVALGTPLPYDFTTVDVRIEWKALKLRFAAKQNALNKLDLEKFLQLHGVIPTPTSTILNGQRKRANSHSGVSSTESLRNSTASDTSDSSHHHNNIGTTSSTRKASYKAILIRSSIAAAAAHWTEESSSATPEVSKPPRPRGGSSQTFPDSQRVCAVSISSSTDPTLQNSGEHTGKVMASQSQPSSARKPSPTAHIPVEERTYVNDTALVPPIVTRRKNRNSSIPVIDTPLHKNYNLSVANNALINTIIPKSIAVKSESSFLPPISHIRLSHDVVPSAKAL